MKTLFKTLLTLIIIIALAIAGIFLFLTSKSGNDTLKPYIKKEIEKQLGMPVDIQTFSLQSDNARFKMMFNKDTGIEVVTNYSLLKQSFKGIYHITASNFVYNEIKLRQADIKGGFEGTPADIQIDGNGTALDAPLDYSLRIVDNMPQKVLANIKSIELAELLQLAAQPSLAKGKIDVNIDMPSIGEDGATGFGHIVLNKATFNDALVKKLYNFELPKKSYAIAKIDATLKGKMIDLLADIKSNLFKINVDNATVDMTTQKVIADYHVDVKEMRILTKNQLSGAFLINGHVEAEGEKYKLTGKSNSLGGELAFDIGEKSKVSLSKLAISKILRFLKQPAYASGELSGIAQLKDSNMDAGSFDMHVKNGKLNQKSIQKSFGYKIPAKSVYTFDSKGDIAKKRLNANVTLHSTLSDLTLSNIKVNLDNQYVDAKYVVEVHDVTMFMPPSKNAKKTKVKANGTFKMTDHIVVNGSTSGLGKKLNFAYDSRTASVDAVGLVVSRLLALGGQPIFAKGTLNSNVKITNLKSLDGTFSLNSSKLVTQPKAMKKLMGKALKTTVKIDSKGKIKKGKAYVNTTIKTGLANVTLKNTVFDIKKNVLNTDYIVDVSDLKKLEVVTGKKLYGKLLLNGKVTKGKTLKVTGVTKSLGGKINFNLTGDNLTSKVSTVPVERILKLLGISPSILGFASGNVKLNVKKQVGKVDFSIGKFQIKPNNLTKTVKRFLKKDPSRIIFKTTKLHADLKGDNIVYTLTAKGTRALIEITSGKLNKVKNTNTAKFKFTYEKTTVLGSIRGSVDNPKIKLDPATFLTDKVKNKLNKKIDKKFNKFLKGKQGEKLNKALGGNVGNLLKGLKF